MDCIVKEKPTTERRHYVRTSTLWSGSLICDGNALDCVILNLSAKGAKIGLPARQHCPPAFALRVGHLGQFRGQSVWENGRITGLRFLEEPTIVAGAIGKVLPLETGKAKASNDKPTKPTTE